LLRRRLLITPLKLRVQKSPPWLWIVCGASARLCKFRLAIRTRADSIPASRGGAFQPRTSGKPLEVAGCFLKLSISARATVGIINIAPLRNKISQRQFLITQHPTNSRLCGHQTRGIPKFRERKIGSALKPHVTVDARRFFMFAPQSFH
jgi:hypothetical protein